MSSLMPMPTVGVIARRLEVSISRVEYLIKSRGIEAIGMAGNARVYSEQAVEMIAQELARLDSALTARSSRPEQLQASKLVGQED